MNAQSIIITLEAPLSDIENDLLISKSIPFIESKSIFGGNNIDILIFSSMSTAMITALSKIIIERIKAKRFISIKKDGIEIKGISENKIKDIISELRSSKKK